MTSLVNPSPAWLRRYDVQCLAAERESIHNWIFLLKAVASCKALEALVVKLSVN